LPLPPGPVSVITRSDDNQLRSSFNSRARPTKRVIGVGSKVDMIDQILSYQDTISSPYGLNDNQDDLNHGGLGAVSSK
jgi:hypothetical protein